MNRATCTDGFYHVCSTFTEIRASVFCSGFAMRLCGFGVIYAHSHVVSSGSLFVSYKFSALGQTWYAASIRGCDFKTMKRGHIRYTWQSISGVVLQLNRGNVEQKLNVSEALKDNSSSNKIDVDFKDDLQKLKYTAMQLQSVGDIRATGYG